MSPKSLYGFAVAIVLLEFATYASNDMIMPAMPEIIRDFKGHFSDIPLSMNLYILGCVAFQLFVAPVSDYVGKKTTMLLGALYFVITTIIIVFSTAMVSFLVIRFVSGASMAFAGLGYAIIHNCFGDKKATKMTSLMQNVTIISPILGPMIGLFIIKAFSWHFVFVFCAVLGVFSFFGIHMSMPKASPPKKKIRIKVMFSDYFTLMRKSDFISGVLACLVMIVPYLLWIAFSTITIKEVLHMDDYRYVILQVLALGGILLSTVFIHLFAGKLSFKVLLLAGIALAVIGLLLPSVCTNTVYTVAVGTMIYGVGAGLFNPLAIRIIATIKFHNRTMIFTLYTFILSGGVFVFISLFEWFFSSYGYSPKAFAASGRIFAVLVVLFSGYFAYRNRERSWQ